MARGEEPQPIRIYLMAEYGSSSLWREEGGVVDLDDLPLTADTRGAIEAWTAHLYRSLEHLEESGPPPDEERFAADGERLWHDLRREWHPQYVVGRAVFSSGEKRVEWAPGAEPERLPKRPATLPPRATVAFRVERAGDLLPGHAVSIHGVEAGIRGFAVEFAAEPLPNRLPKLSFASLLTDTAGGTWSGHGGSYGPDWNPKTRRSSRRGSSARSTPGPPDRD